MKKLGAIFMVTAFAFAGVGISYAGFYDEILVTGYVDVATVTLDLEYYSCTEIWKVWGGSAPIDEVYIWHGWCDQRPTADQVISATGAQFAMPVSWANASEIDEDTVYVEFDNIFPCVNFIADFVFHYEGSIPAKIQEPEIVFDPDFPVELEKFIEIQFYEFNELTMEKGNRLFTPIQVHLCNYVYVMVIINLEQNNNLQNLEGGFSFTINAKQWNDECETPSNIDFGDAPDSESLMEYPTLLSNDGARHTIGGPWLGDINDKPDSDLDGQPNPNALGDDNDGNDDENGVIIPPLIIDQPVDITVNVNNDVGSGGILGVWIDYNGNKHFDSRDDMVFNDWLPNGPNIITVVAPSDISTLGQTFARFRISTSGTFEPFGPADDGEVEDYMVFIEDPGT